MVSRKVTHNLDEMTRNRYKFQYILLSVFAIAKGSFFLYHDGYLLSRAEPYMEVVPESLFGWVMVISGVLLLIGHLGKKMLIKKIALFTLSVTWGGMFLVSLAYAFGSGYPDAAWMDILLVLCITLRLSKRGVPS